MCGIVGAVGCRQLRSYLIDGLKTLEYRGYDSSGLAFSHEEAPLIYRIPGRVHLLEEMVPLSLEAGIGIGHTRWATHGAPTETNAHPHISHSGLFTLVHNGVIDNYRALHQMLSDLGYQFNTETDTEVIANLIEHNYKQMGDVLKALRQSMKMLEGSYALVIIHQGDDERLFFAKNHSPLLIGHGPDANFLASDYLPMLKHVKDFYALTDHQFGYISKDEVAVFDLPGNSKAKISYHQTDLTSEDINLEGYPHYMLKEIEEADNVIRHLIDNYHDGRNYLFNPKLLDTITASDQLIFLACGTSYHACLIGKRYLEALGKRVDVYIASEWAYYPVITGKNPLFIIVSQSGETADLIHCVKNIKQYKFPLLTITNTKGSTLDREANFTLLLFAGIEIAVASTKAYVAQVTLLALLAAALKGDSQLIPDLYHVIEALKKVIDMKSKFEKIADFLATKENAFYLGRGFDYDVSLEASLKLKEITYIHSEGLPGGELKHGPIALIDKDTPVIIFVSDSLTALPIRSNLQEVLARGAHVIVISSQSLAKGKDAIVVPDVPVHLSVLPKVMVAQYLAYYTALKRGANIDKPRNLAKSVTVE
ncbi:MAG TPA: glutamine--fructose-6-phosphate transaminase (isomerizing) [Bacilli bacterium]|nr:glutamine--fructose-6-phosphate transaminase (isomerizing) [Bacilli bacterium]